MKSVLNGMRRLVQEEEGANGVEYAMLAGLIAIAFVVAATALGTNINATLQTIAGCVTAPSTATCPITGV